MQHWCVRAGVCACVCAALQLESRGPQPGHNGRQLCVLGGQGGCPLPTTVLSSSSCCSSQRISFSSSCLLQRLLAPLLGKLSRWQICSQPSTIHPLLHDHPQFIQRCLRWLGFRQGSQFSPQKQLAKTIHADSSGYDQLSALAAAVANPKSMSSQAPG